LKDIPFMGGGQSKANLDIVKSFMKSSE